MPYSPARRAVTFLRKSNQKTFLLRSVRANKVLDKSKFEAQTPIFKKALDKSKKYAIIPYDADVCVRLSVVQKYIRIART